MYGKTNTKTGKQRFISCLISVVHTGICKIYYPFSRLTKYFKFYACRMCIYMLLSAIQLFIVIAARLLAQDLILWSTPPTADVIEQVFRT